MYHRELYSTLCNDLYGKRIPAKSEYMYEKDNLEEMDRFLEHFNLPRLNQEETEIMNKSVSHSTEIKFVIKNLQKQKPWSR